MDVLNEEEYAGEILYHVRVSESELNIFQGCIEYLLKHADPEAILLTTGFNEKQLKAYGDKFRQLLLENVIPEFLIPRLKQEKGLE